MYDIIFISYNEPNADKNWELLKSRFPTAQRVHGIKGIHEAHMIAAIKSWTKMFWVVDGDAEIKEDFDFSYFPNEQEEIWPGVKALNTVHVWNSENSVNGLVYGYGGVKLLPKMFTLGMDLSSLDMTRGISKHFKVMEEVSNITAFNVDEFSTWKSAFRECVKLTNNLNNQLDYEETELRLHAWLHPRKSSNFYDWARHGAEKGHEFGKTYSSDIEKLKLINDFDWLKEQFQNVTL